MAVGNSTLSGFVIWIPARRRRRRRVVFDHAWVYRRVTSMPREPDVNGAIAARRIWRRPRPGCSAAGTSARGRDSSLEKPGRRICRRTARSRRSGTWALVYQVILEVLETGASLIVEQASRRAAETPPRSGPRYGSTFSRDRSTGGASQGRLRRRVDPAVSGDLQMHSVWSDGSQTLGRSSRAASSELSCRCHHHSYGLPIARGMSCPRSSSSTRE